jgi:hypothetical protein
LTVSTTPPPPLRLAADREFPLAVLRELELRFDPLLDAREAPLADRVARLRFVVALVLPPEAFLAPEVFRVVALAELVDRFVVVRAVFPAIV